MTRATHKPTPEPESTEPEATPETEPETESAGDDAPQVGGPQKRRQEAAAEQE